MKILFVLEHFHPYIGGAEKLFYVLTTNLAKKGMEVTVITTRFAAELPVSEVHEGVKIIRINSRSRYAFTLLSLPMIIRHARRCDLVHTTTYNAALPALIGSKLTGKPVFITFHEVWGELWKRLPFVSLPAKYAFYFFEKMLLKLPFDRFIAVSEFTQSKLLAHGVPTQKTSMIYNGIDYAAFRNLQHQPPAVFTFTFFGRLGISKGLDVLLPAAAAFRKQHPESVFKLIIPTTPTSIFKKINLLIREYELSDYLQLYHNLPRTQLYETLLTSSCVVIPSYSEGFCFAAAETVALGIPIVSSQQGALAEVVSGKMIAMESMTTDGLENALLHAYQKIWTEVPIRHYPLSDAIKHYKKLYKDVTL